MENNWIKTIIMIILFFVFLSMVILGQKNLSLTGLGIQVVGLAGLLVLLYIYNRKYK